MPDTVVAWSGGKDSAYGLYRVLQQSDVSISRLVTTVSAVHDRVSIHGVRTTLLEQQAASLGIPLDTVTIPANCSQEQYDALWADTLQQYRKQGVEQVVFSDIFLETARRKRERQLQAAGLQGRWPLWGEDTEDLITDMLNDGFRSVAACIDAQQLDPTFAGRAIDASFIADIPELVDPCGEYGEFHTFTWDGPIFDEPIPVQPSGTVERDVENGTHCYCDIRLVENQND